MNEHIEWLKISESNLTIGKGYHKFSDEDIRCIL